MLEYDFLRMIDERRHTFQEFPLPVVITNLEFQVYWSNDLARSLFSPATNTRGLARLLAEFSREDILAQVRDQGVCILSDILPFSGMRVSFSPLRWEGELVGLVLTLLGQQVIPNAQDVYRASRTAESLSAGIRHAVDQVFSIMDTAAHKADILEMGWIKPSFERIGYYGYRILRLSDNIAEYTRWQNGMMQLSPKTVDLTEFLRELRGPLEAIAAEVDIPITFEIQEGRAPVQLDPHRFELVLLNLLHNALYYTRPGNAVALSASASRGEVILQVADRGLGIPGAYVPKVFLPYFSHDVSGKEPTIGLGLTLAKLLTEAHGGGIALESREGEGTAVTLTFPENGFSGTVLMAQSFAADQLSDRFSRIYTGLADVAVSPHR